MGMGTGDSVSVSQVCKLQAQHGALTLLAAGGGGNSAVDPHHHHQQQQQHSHQSTRLALATSTGAVQVWDVEARRVVCSWGTKGVGAMVWGADGAVLSIGGPKGAIRHYDTRAPQGKVHTNTEQAAPGKAGAKSQQQLTRHQTGVAALAWGADGRLLASGDAGGVVYTWDARAGRAPLDVGEFLQRRKKMQHAQPISALAWCPWQPKLLASGDAGGTVRFWSVEPANTSSNATAGRLELGSRVAGLHWAPGYKELLTTLGPAAADSDGAPWRPRGLLSNALAVHAFPSLRPIASLSLLGAASSAHAAAVHKVVVAVPGEGKLKVYEVWGRRRERVEEAGERGELGGDD
ncbi:WD40-repeat-containing domain protein [Mycena albidolilacea]|uniref:WD40-repeat-containing domain protein n=1 Tax=Mycena albidolilacea TaxID=1033008 RepID=A0AAD7A9V7_9AGAR|nr:WD40-repeat-containing domain protein [Mycena albidolilacea]